METIFCVKNPQGDLEKLAWYKVSENEHCCLKYLMGQGFCKDQNGENTPRVGQHGSLLSTIFSKYMERWHLYSCPLIHDKPHSLLESEFQDFQVPSPIALECIWMKFSRENKIPAPWIIFKGWIGEQWFTISAHKVFLLTLYKQFSQP